MWFTIFLALVIVAAIAARFIGQVKPLAEVHDAAAAIVRTPVPTQNPHLAQAFRMPAYGRVPPNIDELMGRATPDRQEEVLAAVFVTRANYRAGYLIATTRYVRWIGTRPIRSAASHSWGSLRRRRFTRHSPIIRMLCPAISTGDAVYYIRGYQKGREFIELLKVLDEAFIWEEGQNQRPATDESSRPGDETAGRRPLDRGRADPQAAVRPNRAHGQTDTQPLGSPRVCVEESCDLNGRSTQKLRCPACGEFTQLA
jgi:hypothetical protein